ncbi:RNA polymerase I-specific transcription initiation factor RRN3 [Meredithblackwellia eburnea MCA 4105]
MDGMKAVSPAFAAASQESSSNTNRPDVNSYKKGMFLAFIDDAFARRAKGDNVRYSELIAQFRSLLPSATKRPDQPPSSSSLAAPAGPSSSSPNADPASPQLKVWLDALTHVVSKLDKTHAPLVETIISLPWATLDDSFVAAYVRFIGALVSARTEWLRPVLEKCVKGFKYRSHYTASSPAAMPTITRRILYGRLHAMFRVLMGLIPTLAPALAPLLARNLPPKRESGIAQICYIDNILSMTEYCSALTEDILTLVVERALNIDVEIQGEPDDWEDVEEELIAAGEEGMGVLGVKDVVDRLTADDAEETDDENDSDGEAGFDLDAFDSDDEPDPVSDEQAAKNAKAGAVMTEKAVRKVLENRGKLDAILKVVFDHLAAAHSNKLPEESEEIKEVEADQYRDSASTTSSQESTPTPELAPSPEVIERRLTLFRTLLDIFDRTLLRTFKTRNTQFILFYLCSLNPESSDHFIGVLIQRALVEADAPAVTRVAAAGYTASFVSRANFVDTSMTRKVIRLLCRFLEDHMDEYDRGESNGQHLPVFYAVAQAVFYIFCFRWKELMDENDEDDIVLEPGRRWMLELETVKRAVGSTFNPLRVCAQSVVTQFATIAHKTNFLYCFNIIESNRRTTFRDQPSSGSSSNSPTRGGAPRAVSNSTQPPSTPAAPRQLLVAEEMDSFFPFDPFKLPLSSPFIDSIYREWVNDDSDDEDSSSDDDDDDASSSEADTETESVYGHGGLRVPGSSKYDVEGLSDEDDSFISKSFEAMSLSPDRPAFGGRGLTTISVA